MLYSIRTGIPVALIVFASILSWWSLRIFNAFEMNRIDTEAKESLRLEMARLQAQAEHSFSVSDLSGLQAVFLHYDMDKTILEAVVLDNSDIIQASKSHAHIGQSVSIFPTSFIQNSTLREKKW